MDVRNTGYGVSKTKMLNINGFALEIEKIISTLILMNIKLKYYHLIIKTTVHVCGLNEILLRGIEYGSVS